MPGHKELADLLEERLASSLPGHAAHAKMAPFKGRAKPDVITVEGKDARRAATLILIYPLDDESGILLTKRRKELRDHSGQISLPGGALEEGETPEQAALREGFEEVGVSQDSPRLLGRLTPLYIPPTNFSVWPIVAWLAERSAFTIQEAEVEALIEVPLALLLDEEIRQKAPRTTPSGTLQVPLFNVFGHEVWGATAMILAEFVALLRRVG